MLLTWCLSKGQFLAGTPDKIEAQKLPFIWELMRASFILSVCQRDIGGLSEGCVEKARWQGTHDSHPEMPRASEPRSAQTVRSPRR